MSTKGNLTREQAIAAVGAEAVNSVESANCDYTGRVMDQSDDRVEFAASVRCTDADGVDCTLRAYYYPTQQELDDCAEDLSCVDWVIHGYEVV
jgi:phage-related protein